MKGKVRSYFFYAFGEILLVVIGILLALQIDNWNEERKNRQIEHEILETLYTNLGQDSLGIREALINNREAIRSMDRIFRDRAYLHYPDSMETWLAGIMSFERIQPRSSGFEVLKSRGLDLIEDEQLRLDLATYYDETLTHILQSLGDIEWAFKREIIPEIRNVVSGFQFKKRVTLKDPEAYLTDISTIAYYQLFRDNREGTLEPLERGLEQISRLRSQIRTQLDVSP
ncbi:MAG: DUF6090 family protein [Robiginitalea sp.]